MSDEHQEGGALVPRQPREGDVVLAESLIPILGTLTGDGEDTQPTVGTVRHFVRGLGFTWEPTSKVKYDPAKPDESRREVEESLQAATEAERLSHDLIKSTVLLMARIGPWVTARKRHVKSLGKLWADEVERLGRSDEYLRQSQNKRIPLRREGQAHEKT
jgi:hypothetical protein